MSQRKFIVSTIIMVTVAAVFWWQYSLNDILRRDNEALRGSMAELRRIQEVREPVASSESPTQEQADELAKLRSEATRLREQTNRIGTLIEANQKLVASLKEAKAARTDVSEKKGPEDALPQDIHPQDTWAFRGYATPEAAMESIFWALAKGDKAAFLGAFSTEMREHLEKDLDGKDFVEGIKSVNNHEFRILDREMLSDDQIMLTVYATHKEENGEDIGGSEKTLFQKIGGEWKLTEKSLH